MFHDNKRARVAGPFGYTLRDLAARTPEEREAMRRELGDLDNKLQWGWEPDRWAKGAAWHDDDWPEPNLLGRGELAGMYEQRDDLIAEKEDFRATLDGADKAWRAEAGLNSPFLPALAAKPREERAQMRQHGKMIRDLVAFGETLERWARGIGYMREGDYLRDPEVDTERLLALHGQRNDLLPALDTMDHALDYLDEVDAQAGAESPDAPADGGDFGGNTPLPEPGPGPQGGGTDGIQGEVPGVEPPAGVYPPGDWLVRPPKVMTSEYSTWLAVPSTPWSRLAEGWRRGWNRLGPVYRRPEDFPGRQYLPDSTVEPAVDRGPYRGDASAEPDDWVRNAYHRHVPGQDVRSQPLPYIKPPEGAPPAKVLLRNSESGNSGTPARAVGGLVDTSPSDGPVSTGAGGGLDVESGVTIPPTGLDNEAEFNGPQSHIGEAAARLAADATRDDSREKELRREGVPEGEIARIMGPSREKAKVAANNLAAMRARQAEIAATAPPPVSTGNAGAAGAAAQAVETLDRALLPAEFLDEESAAMFGARTGYGLERGADGFTLTDAQGRELFDLDEEEAAALARARDPEIFRRAGAMGVLGREDLTPEERRGLLAQAIGADGLSPDPRPSSGRARFAGDPARILARRRLKAYDTLEAALEAGASDEELGALTEDFQAAMLPEVFGNERLVRELVKDVVPGLGNIRSARHLQNDIAAVDRAIETGEWGDAAMASGMAVLDAVGLIPGGNLIKAGVKGAGRGIARATARTAVGKLAARYRLAGYVRNADKTLKSGSVEQYFGKVWPNLSPEMQGFLRGRYKHFAGRGGEKKVIGDLDQAGFEVSEKFDARKFDLPPDANTGRRSRVYDTVTKDEIDTAVKGLFVVPKKGASVLPTGIESKVAGGKYLPSQSAADEVLEKSAKGVASARVMRLPAKEIKPELLAGAVNEWLKRPSRIHLGLPGGVPRKEVEDLIAALQKRGDLDVGQLVGLTMYYALGRAAMKSGGGGQGFMDDPAAMP